MENTKPIFICEFKNCEKIFTTKYSLSRHMQVHFKKKKFACKECKKTFSLKHNLIEHEFVHTGELPYVWNFNNCTERFRQRGKLSIHRQTHKNYVKKTYRTHTSNNEGGSSRRTTWGHSTNLMNSSCNRSCPQIQNISNYGPLMQNLNQMASSMYLFNTPCTKVAQPSYTQSLISLSQNLNRQNYQTFQASMASVNSANSRVTPGLPSVNAPLPKLSMVMMANRRLNCQFN